MEVEDKERAYTSPFVPPKDLSEEDTSWCIQHIHKLIVDSQHLLPLEIYEKVFSVLELLKIWHDQKPELDRVHSDLDEAVRHFYTLFKDYCLLTRHEMRKHDLIAELTQSLGSITDQIEKLRAVSRIEEVTDNLEDLTIEPEDLPKIEYIENGILLMKSHFDGNKLVESETSDKFFRTAFTVLETISEKGLRVLAHKLKKSVFVDSTRVLETFIDYYLNHGVNSLFPVKLLKSILCSSKVHNFVKKFQKDRFTALFVKFYTSQSRLIHLDASVGIATFIRETYKDEQLVDLFERIDFARTNTVAYIKPLFEAFFGTNQSDDTSLRFIRTLIEAKKLQHLDNEIVGRDVPVERILKIINQYCLMRPKQLLSGIQFHNAFKPPNLRLKLGRRVFKGSCKDRFNHVLNLTFIRCVKAYFHSVPLKYQPMFVRILYFAALDTPNSVQISESASEEDNTAVRKLANNLQKLWSYKILEINIFVWKKFYSSAGSLQTRSFRDCIDYLTTVVEHVTSVPQDRLSELESLTLKKGIQKSGKVAIQELIKHLFKGDNPFKWDVTSINDRVLYLYCFFKYPFESFVDWTKQLNSSAEFYSQEDMNTLFETFNEKKKRVIGLDNIAKYGYKYIQNNQLTTILAALEATSNGKHFFAKQGTGQGKSLTLALLALNFAKTGKRVMIFSCYDHLAKRDHAAFQQMYSDNRITSAYIEEANAEQLDAKVMYANLETFIRLYYSNTEKLAKGDEDGLRNFPIFGIDVILLDEFDALILDSRKIGNRVYDMSSLYSLGSFASAEEAKRSFKRKLSEVEGMRNFMNQGWTSQLINSWTGGFSDEEGHESTNYLGNRVCYVGGEWYELSKGNFYLYCSKIDVLSYLLSAPVLVGLSGSINEASMRMIRQTLTSINSKKEIQYLNVPNFYGIGASRNVAKTIQKNLSPSEWDTQIQRDLDSNGKDRPVLVFGNVNNPNQWNSLKSLLQNFAQENKRRFQIIDKEEQTTDIAMMHACEAEYITLATHIVGRGADFKIHPEIDAKGGLHVLITGIPNNDPRLYTQMIGRTARMTNQGSHSVILREALPPEDIQPINISSFHKQMNEVMSQVQGYLTSLPYSKENWRRWLLILNALLRTESWPVSGSTDSIALELARGVVDKHVNSALLQKFKIKNPQETANRRRTRSNEQQCIIA